MADTRRDFLITAAGVGASFLLADSVLVREALAHATQAVQQPSPPPFTTLSASESRELAAIAERIVPTTETPGAREAGVIFFIDKALGTFQRDALPPIRRGLADLRRRSVRRKPGAKAFADLAPADQDALLVEIEEGEFFGRVRFLTMVGMFANPSLGGNRDQAGWKILGFEPKSAHSPPFGYYDAEAARGR